MSKWKNRRVLITGGAGFIGSNLAARLVREGAQVRVADNLERGQLSNLAEIRKEVEFLQLDLRQAGDAKRAVAGQEVIFHLAAIVAAIKVYIEKPGTVILNNLLIDQNLLAAAIAERVPFLFYASSSHVYPEHLQQSPDAPRLTEKDAYPAAPGLSYGWAKLVGEIAALELAREHDWISVSVGRICGAYGYHQEIDIATGSLIPALCHRAARWPELKPFVLRGTGKEKRSYCFVDDIVEALLRAVEAQYRQRIVGPFNISEESQVSVHEIAEAIILASGKDIPIQYDPSFPTPLWSQTVDCARARELLDGWQPTTTLAEGLRRTYQHIAARVKSS